MSPAYLRCVFCVYIKCWQSYPYVFAYPWVFLPVYMCHVRLSCCVSWASTSSQASCTHAALCHLSHQTGWLCAKSVWLCLSHARTLSAAALPLVTMSTTSWQQRRRSEVTWPHSQRLWLAPVLRVVREWMNPFSVHCCWIHSATQENHLLCPSSMLHLNTAEYSGGRDGQH